MSDWSGDNQKVLSLEFRLSISPDEYVRYYRGQVKFVMVTSNSGLKVRFPANLLTPYVSRQGVQGHFILRYLATGKAVSLDKIT